jgi:hypothetical protein
MEYSVKKVFSKVSEFSKQIYQLSRDCVLSTGNLSQAKMKVEIVNAELSLSFRGHGC